MMKTRSQVGHLYSKGGFMDETEGSPQGQSQ